MYKHLQTHTNIVEARAHAVKLMTRHTGLSYYLNDKRVTKGWAIHAIKGGFLDSYFYQVDWTDSKRVDLTHFNANNFLHKIGV